MSGHKSRHGKQNPASGQKKADSEEKSTNRHVYVEPGVEIDLVQDLKEKYESSQTETATHNKKQFLWTTITTGLVFLTAALAGWQGWSTKKAAGAAETAANVAKDSMQIDQRAWLAVTDIYTTTNSKQHELGLPLYARIQFRNAGKTPALYTRISRNEGRVEADYMPDTIKDIDYSKIDFTPSGSVPPNSDNPFTEARFVNNLSKKDLEAIRANKLHFFVYGKAIYCDVFGKEHWTTYCYHLIAGGAYAVCRNNNEIDTGNDEPCHGK